jgi:type II secretory pathway pseudopilin PulG
MHPDPAQPREQPLPHRGPLSHLLRPAYTLVEILVVMALILLAAGMLTVVVKGILSLVRALARGS